MELGKLGVFFFCDVLAASEAASTARRIEDLGYGTLWYPEAVGRESFAAGAWLLAATEKLNVASGIANIYARDSFSMAAGARTLAEQSGGRFICGIGVSHKPMVEGLRGHVFDKPLTYMRGYLDGMQASMYAAPAPAEEPPFVIGALHPKMLALAGERTAGAHPYLMPPEHTEYAREILGADAVLCPEQKVLLESDPAKARAIARQSLDLYRTLPNYQRSLQRFGLDASDFEGQGSDRFVDTCVAWGDEDTIAARVKAHHDAGADHVCIQPIHPEGLPQPDWRVLEIFAPAKN